MDVEESVANQYMVEAIRDMKIVSGKSYYNIKWLGYPEEENTWEPRRNLEGAMSLVREFEDSLQNQKRSKSAGARTPKQPKQSSNRGQTHPRSALSETSKRFENLNLNIENQSANEPARHVPSKSEEFSQDHEGCPQQSTDKSRRGRKPKSRGPYDRKVLANANLNVSRRADACIIDDSISDFDSAASTASNNVRSIETQRDEEFTLEKLKRCSASQIEIVGAEPVEGGVRIGIRALDDENVFRLDSREVTDLWPQVYVSFLEKHIRFDDTMQLEDC